MPDCKHDNIVSNVLASTKGGFPGFAEITIKCADCGEQFCFVGVNRGLSAHMPTVNQDGTELRIPIVPKSSLAPAAIVAPGAPPGGKPS